MKQIKLDVAKVDGFDKCIVKVQAQTHRGTSFGRGYSNRFVANNGVTLGSNRHPSRDAGKSTAEKLTFWLRGSDSSKDGHSFVIPVAKLPKLAAAVEEYNRTFADAAPAAPAYSPCVVTIQ